MSRKVLLKFYYLFMDESKLNSYLNLIGDLIIGEDKIVTYKSLSILLRIHINTAKQLLHAYFVQQKNLFPISATYFLAGKLKNSNFNVTIVNEKDKAKEAAKFSEITSEHIYSVQRGEKIENLNALFNINSEKKNESKKQYVIQCSKSFTKTKVKQSCDVQIPDVKPQKKTCIIKSQFSTAAAKDNNEEVEIIVNVPGSSKEKVSPINKTKTNGGTQKNQSFKDIASLFSCAQKQATHNSNLDAKNISVNDEKVLKTKAVIKKSKGTSPQKSKTERTKRKRIKLLSNSDDSSDGGTSDVEEPQPLQQEDEITQVKSLEVSETSEKNEKIEDRSHNKRKKRKMIDVTMLNDDGYLETRKQITYTTDSEEEATESLPQQENSSLAGIKKNSKYDKIKDGNLRSSGPKKQSSLLTFFKKN